MDKLDCSFDRGFDVKLERDVNSKAPISQATPCGLERPSKSVETGTVTPVSIAGLPIRRWKSVGPTNSGKELSIFPVTVAEPPGVTSNTEVSELRLWLIVVPGMITED